MQVGIAERAFLTRKQFWAMLRLTMDRRDFLKTAGGMTAGAMIGESLKGAPQASAIPKRAVQPFRLNQVVLGDGLFREKRDRMLNYG